ncbi:gephyrin-like molybdotransferase Glp [Ferruginivarius sediminum]|uniref:Molybdopterin molybdenumtransferase n=1 Tax=Ferruginivarius sediminum TaxID=2661937 RepID=A0A369TB87_9PROT|nr:gephyrin-like molybdotransferase Glp [Ferruginivarius sediminum]RDD62122.1 molybdopterin molybdenumtransferase MoeA [Ferruginivarius sediminum]
MQPVEDARARILAAFAPLPAETVNVAEALGRVLAEDLTSRVTQPPKNLSAMDGYAVRAADVAEAPVTLRVVGDVPAGSHYPGALDVGEAVRIFTGGPLPAGADTIVIQENATRDDDRVTIHQGAAAGTYVRPAGLDFTAGQIGICAGRRLTSRDVGLAAAMNRPWLRVHRRPRVAILATGDEIVLPGDPLMENQIVSSNGFALAAFVQACGGEPLHLGIAPDDAAALGDMIDGARGSDMLLTSGGASVGQHDLVQDVLRRNGAEIDFWKIAMRPGKPLMFGRLGNTPVVGLPGNPVSSLVCAAIFARPAIARMLGQESPVPESARAVLGCDLPANDRRQDYLRARLETDGNGKQVATPFNKQDSSMLTRMARADCLVVRPPEAPPAKAGDAVEIVPFGGGHLEI